jgi:hypothetical protein
LRKPDERIVGQLEQRRATFIAFRHMGFNPIAGRAPQTAQSILFQLSSRRMSGEWRVHGGDSLRGVIVGEPATGALTAAVRGEWLRRMVEANRRDELSQWTGVVLLGIGRYGECGGIISANRAKTFLMGSVPPSS